MSKVYSNFIEPISSSQPEGIDVEYDERFMSIQSLAEGKAEQQYGDVIIEAEEPDWRGIEKLCIQLLSESKDLRVFCFYTQAMTVNYGIEGFYRGCESLLHNLENYWNELYPKLLDEDSEYDPFYRLGSVELLISQNGIVKQLLNCDLIRSEYNKDILSLGFILSILNDNATAISNYVGGKQRLLEDLKVAFSLNDEKLNYLKKCLDILNVIEKVFNEKLPDDPLDFSVIKTPFATVYKAIEKVKIQEKVEDVIIDINNDNDPIQTTVGSELLNKSIDLNTLDIKNREEVRVIFDKLTLYFRVKEPSHPAPLFIERLKRLLDMNFYEILQDISPDSLDSLEMIIGKTKDSEFNED